jgi:hypothetical protein
VAYAITFLGAGTVTSLKATNQSPWSVPTGLAVPAGSVALIVVGFSLPGPDLNYPNLSDDLGNVLGAQSLFTNEAGAYPKALCVIYTSRLTTAWLTTTNLTFDWAGTTVGATAQTVNIYAFKYLGLSAVNASTAVVNSSVSSALSSTLTPAAALNLVVGLSASAAPTTAVTGDADTTAGSWSAILGAGTTGGTATTNVMVRSQYKIVSSTVAQTWNTTYPPWTSAALFEFEPEYVAPNPISIHVAVSSIKLSAVKFSETAGATDSLIRRFTYAESSTVTDTAALRKVQRPAERAGSSDTAARTTRLIRQDRAGASDAVTVTVTAGAGLSFADDAGAGDSRTAALTLARTDAAASSDARAAALAPALADDAGASDATASAIVLADDVGASDSYALHTTLSFADDAGAGDSRTAALTLARTDAAASSDARAAALATAPDEDAGASDDALLRPTVALQDTAAGSDIVSLVTAYSITLPADDAGARDTHTSSLHQAVTDSAGAADAAALATRLELGDTVDAADTATPTIRGAIAWTAQDDAGATDATTFTASGTLPLLDLATSTDSVQISGSGVLLRSDLAGAVDDVALTRDNHVTYTDVAGSADNTLFAAQSPLVDTAAASDIVTFWAGHSVSVLDTAEAADSYTLVRAFTLTLSDQADAADALTRATSTTLTFTESAGARDNGLVWQRLMQPLDDTHATDADTDTTTDVLVGGVLRRTRIMRRTSPSDASDQVSRTASVTLPAAVAGATDSAAPVVALGINLAFTDSAVASDAMTLGGVRALIDTVTADDTTAAVRDTVRRLSELATPFAYPWLLPAPSDTATLSARRVGLLTSTAGAVDDVSVHHRLVFTDSAGCTDAAAPVLAHHVVLSITEQVTAADSFGRQADLRRVPASVAGATDAMRSTGTFTKAFTDDAAPTDAAAPARTFAFPDLASVVDLVRLTLKIGLTDSAGAASGLAAAAAIRFIDTTTVTDRADGALLRVRHYTDRAGASDPNPVVTRTAHGPVTRPRATAAVARPQR